MLTNFCLNDNESLASKREILQWINRKAQVQNSKNIYKQTYVKNIQQLGNGAAYCKLFNRFFPGLINYTRVRKNPIQEWESLQNFKLLQVGLDKLEVKKDIHVDRLVRSGFQDNLEFAQWMRRFWQLNFKDQEIDIVGDDILKEIREDLGYESEGQSIRTIKKIKKDTEDEYCISCPIESDIQFQQVQSNEVLQQPILIEKITNQEYNQDQLKSIISIMTDALSRLIELQNNTK